MSTPATETARGAQDEYRRAQGDEAANRQRGGGVFQRKYGPLPGWAWALIIAGGGVAYFLWRRRSNAAATSSGTATSYTGTGTAGAAYGAELAAIQREIASLQNGSAGTGTTTTTTNTVKVPRVTGLTVNRAHELLSSAGLTFNENTAKDKPGQDRIVTAQTPAAGSSVAKGTKVALAWHYVKHPKPVTKGHQ